MERIICLVIGYVCGLFQTGYIIGKLHKTDIREHGSGNAGTTNAFRTFGKKAGALTLLGDCLKCVLAIVIVRMIYGNSMSGILPLLTLYAALGCILGHNFPISMEFRGGKGIAASVGMIIAFDWRIFIVCAVVFFALFFTTHYVSLCSLSAYAAAFNPGPCFWTYGKIRDGSATYCGTLYCDGGSYSYGFLQAQSQYWKASSWN